MIVRMKDIAKDLGVSTITVSKVLRNHPDISDETKQRVLRRVKELNYRPSLTARALVTGKTFALGLVAPDLVHPFFGEVAKGLADTLRDKGYDLFIASSEEDTDVELRAIEQMLARGVDALLVASAQTNGKFLEQVAKRQVPYVLIDRQFNGTRANFIGVDDNKVGVLATEHLISVGCRRIAHIRGPNVSTAAGRTKGYTKALQSSGLLARPEYLMMEVTGDESADINGYRAMTQLLQLNPKPDGVFCYNDPTAMGAMQAILDAGLRVPDDIAVIGCGNVRYAPFLRVPLSSIDQRSYEMGTQAALLALDLVEAKSPAKPRRILVDAEVVSRASTARNPSSVERHM